MGLQNAKEDSEEVLRLLPPQLQNELLFIVRKRPVLAHPFFYSLHEMAEDVVHEICVNALKLEFIGATTVFFAKDSKCTSMVFVLEGELGYSVLDCKQYNLEFSPLGLKEEL